LRGERRQHATRAVNDAPAEDIGEERAAVAAGEVEAHIAITGHARVEAHAARHEPRDEEDADHADQSADHRRECQCEVVGDQQRQHDDAADQDADGIGVVIEAGAGEPGIAVEIALAAHLRPGRVDAERDDRQEHIDDPDAEIFAGRAGEAELLAAEFDRPSRGRGFRLGPLVHSPLSWDMT